MQPALDPHRALGRIDPDPLHHRQIDDQAVVDAAEARPVVAAAADGDEQLVVAAEIHRGHHVGDVRAARDEQRPLVDHAVVKLARLIIVRVVAPDDGATEALVSLAYRRRSSRFPPSERFPQAKATIYAHEKWSAAHA